MNAGIQLRRDELRDRQAAWDKKTIVRMVYFGWYRQILADMKRGSGPSVELAAGIGNFKQFRPQVVAADLVWHAGLDVACDAHRLPFADASVDNLVMIDGFHHLADPMAFLREAARALAPGGRLLLLEPYPSPWSLAIYRLFHREPFDFRADYFGPAGVEICRRFRDGNQAAAYLVFFRNRKAFSRVFSRSFRVVKTERLSCLSYPLSGGFSRRSLLPTALLPAAQVAEAWLAPLGFLLAFRCYIILEKT
jgi:SAM-dependent methyltransferase